MMYSFSKNFGCPSEAIREILNLSYSLKESNLRFFEDSNTLEEFEGWVETLEEEKEWTFQKVKPTEKGFVFCFRTSSGINNFGLRVEEGSARARYVVESKHSIRDSSIASIILDAGWTLINYYNDEQERLMKEEDQRREEELRRCVPRGELLSPYFHVDFFPFEAVNRKGEAVICYSVSGYSIATDPGESLAALKLCPDLKEQVRAICEKKLAESFKTPGPIEFNEEFYENSDWFDKRFRSYQDGLRTLLEACKQ